MLAAPRQKSVAAANAAAEHDIRVLGVYQQGGSSGSGSSAEVSSASPNVPYQPPEHVAESSSAQSEPVVHVAESSSAQSELVHRES